MGRGCADIGRTGWGADGAGAGGGVDRTVGPSTD